LIADDDGQAVRVDVEAVAMGLREGTLKGDPESPFFKWAPEEGPHGPGPAWLLLDLLVAEMKRRVNEAGAGFLVFCEEGEEGRKQYYQTWGAIRTRDGRDWVAKDGVEYPIDWQRPLKRLRAVCAKHEVPLIEPRRTYARYRHDVHPDAAGNLAMAEDIVDFLVEHELVPVPDESAAR
jgi:hypothetical protein